jgi:hypothetical protein
MSAEPRSTHPHFRIRVALRGEDLAAISALEALRDELGAEDLAALSRETVWEIGLAPERGSALSDDERLAARGRLEKAARESLLFANPVKERWVLEEGAIRLAAARAPGRRLVGLLVRDLPDREGPARARALESAWGMRGVSVRRETLWTLDLRDAGREATARRAQSLGVTTRRRAGLLVNPHYQEWEILLD